MYPYFLAKANMLCSSMSLVEEDLTSSLNSTATTENYNDNKTVSKVEISYLELSSEMKFCYNNEILFKISSCCKNWGIVQLGECEMTCWKTILWAILFGDIVKALLRAMILSSSSLFKSLMKKRLSLTFITKLEAYNTHRNVYVNHLRFRSMHPSEVAQGQAKFVDFKINQTISIIQENALVLDPFTNE